MKRNIFVSIIILLFLQIIHGQSNTKFSVFSTKQKLINELKSMPNFCSHEHWGSIDAMGGYVPEYDGFYADIYAGATPQTSVSIWDLIFDPYFGGMLWGAGIDANLPARNAGFENLKLYWENNPKDALESFKSTISPMMSNGTFQCTLRGIEKLYNVNLLSFNLIEWEKADKQIRENYSKIMLWYPRAMEKAHFNELIRPVQPEFYFLEQSVETKAQELAFTHTILRIDPFLNFWNVENKRRDNLAKFAGIDPIDAPSWRAFIKFYVDLAEKNHTVGIKQLQAYRRTLDYKFREDNEVKFRGNLTDEETTAFQDWVMHEFCRLANQKSWVHQMHIGTHNLQKSSPLPLESLGKRYPKMKIVMLHCWPFYDEVAYLAKNFNNFYIDNCWMPVLSPTLYAKALDTYLNFVPSNKIMIGHDATTVEMAVGSSLFAREILVDKLFEQKKLLKLSDSQLRTLALDLLHNNAVRVYGIGEIAK